jgi:hypothetical protein
MIAVKGPEVTAAKLVPGRSTAQDDPNCIPTQNGTLQLTTSGGAIVEVKRFTTMERFKADVGKGYYVQLRPQSLPYPITYEPHNKNVKDLWGKTHPGECFRVHGGHSLAEGGILIHEAPKVAWLTGCISPRPLGDYGKKFHDAKGNPSNLAMTELIQFVGKTGKLFVLDW